MVVVMATILGLLFALIFSLVGLVTYPIIVVFPATIICICSGFFFWKILSNNYFVWDEWVITVFTFSLSFIIGTIFTILNLIIFR